MFKPFQFQNGAIKRARAARLRSVLARFQFQNGAIKRQIGAVGPQAQHRFNSKMVRLKAAADRRATWLKTVSIPKWCD